MSERYVKRVEDDNERLYELLEQAQKERDDARRDARDLIKVADGLINALYDELMEHWHTPKKDRKISKIIKEVGNEINRVIQMDQEVVASSGESLKAFYTLLENSKKLEELYQRNSYQPTNDLDKKTETIKKK